MYYRYETQKEDGTWTGVCTIFNPSQRRKLNRFIRAPKWYNENGNADKKSTCWLTEEGFKKYDGLFMTLINQTRLTKSCPPIRLRIEKDLPNIVMKGKIQVINLECDR